MGAKFSNPITVQGFESDDARLFMEFIFRPLPLTMRFARKDEGGHWGAEDVGVLQAVREATDQEKAQLDPPVPASAVVWWGDGEYADGIEAADTAVALAMLGAQFFSADPGGKLEYHWEILDEAGNVVPPVDVEIAYEKVYFGSDDAEELKTWLSTLRERTVFDLYEVGAITQVGIPCWAQCRIALSDAVAADGAPEPVATQGLDRTDPATVKARSLLRRIAAGPAVMPAAAFAQTEFKTYTPMTVDADGVISGHIAPWNACHRGFTQRCVTPQYQESFDEFHVGGHVALDDGTKLEVGVLTHIDGHCRTIEDYRRLSEDPRAQLGPVRAYADRWGIAVAGMVWPDVEPVEIARALAGRPSGDWRPNNGAERLYGIAMVNTPGYVGIVEEEAGEVVRMVAAFPPPPLGDGTQLDVGNLFFDVPSNVLAQAACIPCQGGEATHDDCDCGGTCGGCGPKSLSASDLADLADLDRAVRTRQLARR